MAEINYTYGISVGNPPEIRKLGVVHYNEITRNTYAEMTPFVRKGRLMRVETVWTPGGGATWVFTSATSFAPVSCAPTWTT